MHLDQLYPCIALSDVVISCTAAPHEIIRKQELEAVMADRQWPLDSEPRKLMIIDIANPPDVESACSDLQGVTLCTLDTLKNVTDSAMNHRFWEAEHADAIVEAYLPEYIKAVNRTAANDALSSLYSWAESIRRRELAKARHRLETSGNVEEILDDMTASLTKKLLDDAARAIKQTAETKPPEFAETLVAAITGRRP